MKEYKEKTDAGLRQAESQTEQIERRMEELEQKIEELEATISRLESKGDQEVAGSLKRTLAQRRQEKAQEQQRAQEATRQLEEVYKEVRAVDEWNNEAHREVAKLQQLGEDVGEAANRIADRGRWVEEQETRYRDLKQRLSRVAGSGSSGYG